MQRSGDSQRLIPNSDVLIEVIIAMELLLSGRLVPMAIMPGWVQTVSSWLPFKWTFEFPIEVFIGQLTPMEIWQGVGMQMLWIAITGIGIVTAWRNAIRKVTAVGS